jgi:hypothetical protein
MNLTAWVSPPPHPLVQTLRAEWTKLRTGAGPFWLLAGVAALTVAVGAAAAGSAQCQSATCGIDPAKVSFTGLCLGQAAVAVAGGAGHRRRVQHRDDHAVTHRSGAHRLSAGGGRFRARRVADPPRPGLYPSERIVIRKPSN